MNIFDDLGDPLGPPAGDALGAVLARARRRRRARRATAATVAVVAVVAIAVSADAMAGESGKVRVALPPAPVATGPSTSAPTSTTPAATELSTTSTTAPVGPTAAWSGRRLTIAPDSLGLVAVGQSLDAAQIAAGVKLDGAADGAYYPTSLPAGFPHLFVQLDPGSKVVCVGAEITNAAANAVVVTTPEGFRLGETVEELKVIYGAPRALRPGALGWNRTPRRLCRGTTERQSRLRARQQPDPHTRHQGRRPRPHAELVQRVARRRLRATRPRTAG